MSPRDVERQRAEALRLPVGSRVKVRGCPGLGVGVVKEHITERRYTDGRTIPLIGWLECGVELEGLDAGESYRYVDRFPARELVAVSQ